MTADLEAIYRDGQGPLWSSPVRLTVRGEIWLNANDRVYKHELARRVKSWREAAHGAALLSPGRPIGGIVRFARLHVVAFLMFGDRRRRDPGNYYPTVKAAVDGIVDAHLIPDDSTKHVVGPDLREHPELSAIPTVRFLLYALPGVE